MAEKERDGIFAALYTPEDALGDVDAAAGQLETLLQLAAGFQFREAGTIEHLGRISAYVELLARLCGWSSRTPPAGPGISARRAAALCSISDARPNLPPPISSSRSKKWLATCWKSPQKTWKCEMARWW